MWLELYIVRFMSVWDEEMGAGISLIGPNARLETPVRHFGANNTAEDGSVFAFPTRRIHQLLLFFCRYVT